MAQTVSHTASIRAAAAASSASAFAGERRDALAISRSAACPMVAANTKTAVHPFKFFARSALCSVSEPATISAPATESGRRVKQARHSAAFRISSSASFASVRTGSAACFAPHIAQNLVQRHGGRFQTVYFRRSHRMDERLFRIAAATSGRFIE